MYLHERDNWTSFTWDDSIILPLVSAVRFKQGQLLGKMNDIGFPLGTNTEITTLTSEIIASSRIEGVSLDVEKVRSSLSRQLGLEDQNSSHDTSEVDGVVDIALDATRNYTEPLSRERFCAWHAALFPAGYSGLYRINVAQYRTADMSVVSGAIGKERVHYQAPSPARVESLMDEFVTWLNDANIEPLIKAGLAHVWFLTIHPFDDGNGRIARTLTELLLARSDHSSRRYYSTANQILATREEYYRVLEQTQKNSADVTLWLEWFFKTLQAALEKSDNAIQLTLERAAFWKSLESVSLNERQRSVLNRLKNGFEGKLTTSKWAKLCKTSQDTALRDIKDLLDKNVLVQDESGGRSTSYHLANLESEQTQAGI